VTETLFTEAESELSALSSKVLALVEAAVYYFMGINRQVKGGGDSMAL